MENKAPDYIGYVLIFSLFVLLTYAAFISYKSIDWNVLKTMESKTLILPTPIPTAPATSPTPIKK